MLQSEVMGLTGFIGHVLITFDIVSCLYSWHPSLRVPNLKNQPTLKSLPMCSVHHTFNPNSWEVESEAGRFLSLMLTWSMKQVPEQPGLHTHRNVKQTKKYKTNKD